MTLIPEIAQVLNTASQEQLPAANTGLEGAVETLRTAADLFNTVTNGSTQPEVERARELMAEAIEGLTNEQGKIASAIGRIATYTQDL